MKLKLEQETEDSNNKLHVNLEDVQDIADIECKRYALMKHISKLVEKLNIVEAEVKDELRTLMRD